MNPLNTAQIGRILAWAAGALAAGAIAIAGHPQQEPERLAPFVATPPDVVERMLSLAKVGPGDVVYDLGCGDGRIVVTAAKELGARGVGIDIDPIRIDEARTRAQREGVSEQTRFDVQDLFETDMSEADVVTLYLLPQINLRLRPQLWRQLRVGTRVVSHAFRMGDWEPERTEQVANATVYRWTIDERVKTALARMPAYA
jgi:SAM-dependent methyltransferase